MPSEGQPPIIEQWSALVTRILAPNPSLMTLDGTNTLIVRAPGSERVVVIDPGPDDEEHLARIEDQGAIELILLTHHHIDHVEAAPLLARRAGAPVRAWEPSLCIDGAPLRDGERVDVGGVSIEVIHTPGHSADSVCFVLRGDSDSDARGSALTGDTILGRGTTIIAEPDGSLGDYLRSLKNLADLGPGVRVLPAHGPKLTDLAAVAADYLEHRKQRLAEVEATLGELDLPIAADEETVAAVAARVYGELPLELRFAGNATTRAQLEYLVEQGQR